MIKRKILKLAIQNLKHRKFRTFIASISVTIGAASLLVFLGLSNGIQNATFDEIEKSNPLTQIKVSPQSDSSNVISFISNLNAQGILKSDIKKFEAIKNVEKVIPETQFTSFASFEAQLLGFSIITDGMLFGLPKEFIEEDLVNPEVWDKKKEPYPAIIPRKILDLYNLTIAGPQNLPNLNEENLIGKDITFYPNYSTFFPGLNKKRDSIKLEVVGFSDKVNIIGLTLPNQIVESLNDKYQEVPTQNEENPSNNNEAKSTATVEIGSQEKEYFQAYVITSSANYTAQVANELEELGFNTEYFQKDISDLERQFQYLETGLAAIAAIILLSTCISIISTFLATIAERTKELGLFRALGANKSQIKFIILSEALIIGLLGALSGILIGLISSIFLNKAFNENLGETSSLVPEKIIEFTPNILIFTLLFSCLLTLLTACLPAKNASNLDPIDSLSR